MARSVIHSETKRVVSLTLLISESLLPIVVQEITVVTDAKTVFAFLSYDSKYKKKYIPVLVRQGHRYAQLMPAHVFSTSQLSSFINYMVFYNVTCVHHVSLGAL